MRKQFWKTIPAVTALAVAALALEPVRAQSPATYKAPRTPGGHADLQGIWQVRNTAPALDLERGSAVIVEPPGGKIPYLPKALARRKKNFENRATDDPLKKCYMPGVPRITYLDFPFQIFQTPNYTLIAYQYIHIYRTIFTNGSQHIDGLDFWNGDSRGHWEGDTLVVDVSDFNAETWLDASGNYHSGALHVVERYTRTGPDTLEYEATLTDPKVYKQPWTLRLTLYRHTEPNFRLLEYECQTDSDEQAKAAGKP
ncbi:MAG TPA: hypothetical protein VMU80_23245 [Bryobacteraceae bacterium]|nr:hypothetical protein [Bryobacteraceae bacterium]HUO32155.1 hypothetical protein [Bryobacteraceae bacterium]